MSEQTSKPDYVLWVFVVAVILLLGGTGYLGYLTYQQQHALETLNTRYQEQVTTSTAALDAASTTIAALVSELNLTAEELEDLEDDYRREKKKNDEFEDQIDRITGTIADLDKLSKTDKELLQKYSKVYFLNENYIPEKLRQIDDEYILAGKKDQYFHASALPFLEEMIEEAADDDIELKIISAYRSFDEQIEVKNGHRVVFGEGANAFSADQGYSEHQLGTAVDFSDGELQNALVAFADTEASEWLLDNAYKYGFTLSYPEGNQYYDYEPWHWRFVGTDLARALHRDDAHFYDWDQREIDEYLIKIFD